MQIPDWLPPIPLRPLDAHKGRMGKLLIIGGSIGLTGAPLLSAMGALRTGVGTVTLAIPHSLHAIVASKIVETMTLPLPDDGNGFFTPDSLARLVPELSRFDAMLIGPGMGRAEATGRFCESIFNQSAIPVVVDADALWHMAQNPGKFKSCHEKIIYTPHAGEMRRLLDAIDPQLSGRVAADRMKQAELFCSRIAGVLVLKGNETLIASKALRFTNCSGNPGMAKGGSGDILAGMITALLARGESPVAAAQFAVFLHGLAGDLAARSMSEEAFLPSDLCDKIGEAWSFLLNGNRMS